MIYIDTSVVLADLFAEAKPPPETLWDGDLASSRLLIYEVQNRVTASGLADSHGERARALLTRVNFTEMSERVLTSALQPFPTALRTLDALHLATMHFLRRQGEPIELASYDNRLLAAAALLGIPAAAI